MTSSLEQHWSTLASSALLGTQRRGARPGGATDAPPGQLADIVTSLPSSAVPDEPTSVLVQVAALSVARRCGLRPGAAAPLLTPAPADVRPLCPAAATRRLTEVIEGWPELVEEWLHLVRSNGLRLPPEVIVVLLDTFRSNPVLRTSVAALGAELVPWLLELFPHVVPAGRA